MGAVRHSTHRRFNAPDRLLTQHGGRGGDRAKTCMPGQADHRDLADSNSLPAHHQCHRAGGITHFCCTPDFGGAFPNNLGEVAILTQT